MHLESLKSHYWPRICETQHCRCCCSFLTFSTMWTDTVSLTHQVRVQPPQETRERSVIPTWKDECSTTPSCMMLELSVIMAMERSDQILYWDLSIICCFEWFKGLKGQADMLGGKQLSEKCNIWRTRQMVKDANNDLSAASWYRWKSAVVCSVWLIHRWTRAETLDFSDYFSSMVAWMVASGRVHICACEKKLDDISVD